MTKDTLYKVGEKVVIIDSHRCWRDFDGEFGIIQSITGPYGEDGLYEVMVENGDVEYFAAYHLRLRRSCGSKS